MKLLYNSFMAKRFLVFGFLIGLIIFGVFIVSNYFGKNKEEALIISGRVEADEIILSARIPGRLKEVFIRDGMWIKKGAVVATVEAEELEAMRNEIRKNLKTIKARIQAQESTLEYLKKRVYQGIGRAEKALSIARARKRQAKAKLRREEFRYKRYESLLKKEVIPEDKFEEIRLAYSLAKEEFNAAVEAVAEAEIMVRQARAEEEMVKAKTREIEALRASLEAFKEKLKQAQLRLSYSVVKAPSDGVILRKVSEPGEFVNAGGVIGVMINPESLYVKTYLPEPYLGRVSLGMEVDVYTDTYPEKAIKGVICHISDKAEFTPKEVQSRQERVKEVFATKICFPSEDKELYRLLKKGMPVDVKIDASGK